MSRASLSLLEKSIPQWDGDLHTPVWPGYTEKVPEHSMETVLQMVLQPGSHRAAMIDKKSVEAKRVALLF